MELFHADETRAQLMAGFHVGAAGIYPTMPRQHRDFFAGLSSFFIATLDDDGWPVATVLNGPAGFISTPDASHLRVNSPRRDDCPALSALHPGKPVGALGLDFSNRRRNRVNGVVSRMDKNRFELAVKQSFGNCPKYIQQRKISAVANHPEPIVHLPSLDAQAKALIRGADTFFIATHAHGDAINGGADISHRGGQPGFIKIDGDTLWVPDYAGNRYMNTLGNLLAEPHAALLFLDFEHGEVLHLQGETEIRWDGKSLHQVSGAERFWCLHINRVWRFPALLPWRGTNREYSPATLATGVWS